MDDESLPPRDEERPRIKVTDRRKFSADGTVRAGEQEPGESAPAEAKLAEAEPTGAEPAGAKPDEAEPAEAELAEEGLPESQATPDVAPGDGIPEDHEGSPIAGPQPSISDLPRDFPALVEGMYFEAMLYLGAIPDPRTGQVMDDTELAKYKIDLLSMLQAKTEGNLSAEEKQQLDEVLYQLRMAYLQKTKTVKL